MQSPQFNASEARPAAPVALPGTRPSCAPSGRAHSSAGTRQPSLGRSGWGSLRPYGIHTQSIVRRDRQDAAGPEIPAREDRGARP